MAGKRTTALGLYIACGEQPPDATIFFRDASADLRQMFGRGTLRSMPVLRGIDLEKALDGSVVGVSTYRAPRGKLSVDYQKIARREARELKAILAQARPMFTILNTRLAVLERQLDVS